MQITVGLSLLVILLMKTSKCDSCLEDEAVMLFDSYFTFESKLGWHRLFLTVESTRGIRTLVVVFELLKETVARLYNDEKKMCSTPIKHISYILRLSLNKRGTVIG